MHAIVRPVLARPFLAAALQARVVEIRDGGYRVLQ
jgi:hypothetical protein